MMMHMDDLAAAPGCGAWDCTLERPCAACRREIEAELEEIDAEIANGQEEDHDD